ncbi:hypothetical protein BgiMline_014146 [Biomphalaria glabrata]|uniref:Uncharacterized protein LOC106064382 n=1 Tax=Biomphalaria glabrata TaxID=6526 RepID=A0A9W3ADA7_BIOGL|nr:uncharacterized protein LOC106064382 [Biomphalaria glabrata]XP_055885129.1 uncharacterized protein LOC106064382 [Biomphalaria glabrata]XP_055885130.1 uncharacterized protein LOC106064382 [Biomphalaria glabrata]KAI8774318.1 CAunnamed protein product [Biomphalaria glabrata]
MNVQRMINNYVPSAIRKNQMVTFALMVIVVVFMIVLGHSLRFDLAPMSFCQSETNLKSIYLNASGIHVIPSKPDKQTKSRDASDVSNNECVDLFNPEKSGKLLICIHDPKKDLMVSAHLKNEGSWEKENVEAMYQMTSMFPGIALVDLGCNLGVFTLPAAKFGMEVIALDAMMDSLQLLQRSLAINGLSCHVTLIHNALHRQRKQLRLAVDPTNIGGSSVVEIIQSRKKKIPKKYLVDAICLNDLAPLVEGKQVFLKIDLEGHEAKVLECAQDFFDKVDVKVVLIEWMYYRHNDEGSKIVKDFLVHNHMVPTWGLDLNRQIDLYASHSWPDNVFWRKTV